MSGDATNPPESHEAPDAHAEDVRLVTTLASARDPGPAMSALLARHEAFAFRLAVHVLGRHEDAAEVVSDAFVRVWTAAREQRFDPQAIRERGLQPWLSRVIVNLANSVWRARTRRTRHEERAAERRAAPATPAQTAAAAEQLDRVREALAALPARQQQAFILSVLEQWPADDVADALETTPGMVRKLVYQARQALRAATGDHE